MLKSLVSLLQILKQDYFSYEMQLEFKESGVFSFFFKKVVLTTLNAILLKPKVADSILKLVARFKKGKQKY